MRKPGQGTSKKPKREKPTPQAHPGDEHEGRIDRIERIHQRPGVRAERLDAEEPLRFRDSDDLETVADAMRRAHGRQHQ